jgi:hypothetical protein
MKLAAIYNVWDGDELLEGSIKQIRDHVDVVIVVWQDVSNHGEYYKPTLPIELIDRTWHFWDPKPSSPMISETHKRQVGIRMAAAEGCTHFILMDCDEYYEPEAFASAKALIQFRRPTSTVVKLKTYYKLPTYQVDGFDTYFVPFICEITPNIKCGNFATFGFYCDPTRQVNSGFASLIPEDVCFMHHYSWIRRDIGRKLNNSSAKINFESKIPALLEEYNKATIGSEISWYEGRKLVEAKNLFNIQIETEESNI